MRVKKQGFLVGKNGVLKMYISGCFWLIYGRRVGMKKVKNKGGFCKVEVAK